MNLTLANKSAKTICCLKERQQLSEALGCSGSYANGTRSKPYTLLLSCSP